MSQRLVEELFVRTFDNPALRELGDGAVVDVGGSRLALTTDSYVVRPLFFPGGDIGSLAVHGTVNDLAMCGARPIALSAGFILEEGFSMAELAKVTASMHRACQSVGVSIVTGDTKVVDRGKGDGVYINTSGIGIIRAGLELGPHRARPGDRVVLSGAIAAHGIAILSVREGLQFDTEIISDSAPLDRLVQALLDAVAAHVHSLRDPTRGGVSSALNEIARASQVGIRLFERALVIDEQVQGACEILGLDPLYVANEGKCLAIVAPDAAELAVQTMQSSPQGERAAIVGEVTADNPGLVTLRSRIGGERVVDMLSGEQLPRIC